MHWQLSPCPAVVNIPIWSKGLTLKLMRRSVETTNRQSLRIVLLRSEITSDTTFEDELQRAGHKVTVYVDLEPVFSPIDFSKPDLLLFDPISKFGMSEAVQHLRENFDGLIFATGHIPDPTITKTLVHFGITKFAEDVEDLLIQIKNVQGSAETLAPEEPARPQSPIAQAENPTTQQAKPVERAAAPKPPRAKRSFSIPSFSLPFSRKVYRNTAAAAFLLVLGVLLTIPFLRGAPEQETVAKALPVVPRLLTEPLAPLTIEELSGEFLPLEIAGIIDHAIVEKSAIAFWGDTAPDAFVTVNGQIIDVSEYGAFVVDYPLEDGANFIEVLASDFQGRTTRQSFTIVSLQ